MLIEFRMKNFRSFRDEQRLSLVASSDKKLPDNLITTEAFREPLLQTAVIYGPNAAGKSNLIRALEYVRSLVVSSAKQPPTADDAISSALAVQPFLFDSVSAQADSEFELTFIESGVRYEYGFRLNARVIAEEWLFAYTKGRAQRWYTRERLSDGSYDWYFGPKLQGEKQRFADITRPDVLFLSLAATLNHPQLRQVYTWFADHLRVIGPETMLEFFTPSRTLQDEGFRQRVVDFLRYADLRIRDVIVREILVEEDPQLLDMPSELANIFKGVKGLRRLEVEMEHAVLGQDQLVKLRKEEESLGTQRLFTMAGPLIDTLLYGRVLVIDELDDSLHPLLVRQIVELFHDPAINQHGAQLIFNTHDATLLDRELFRRDQVWFVERDQTDASQLYPLSDYHPRDKESLMRGYLQGRYGALPFIDGRGMRMLESESHG